MTVQCDYFVATFVADDSTGLLVQRAMSKVSEGRRLSFRGFIGNQVDKLFIGYRDYDDRIMIQATGAVADEGIVLFQSYSLGKKCSIARFDAQITFVIDNADNTILFAQPNKRYKAMRVSSINERGETLYVGSPTSSYRLRVYNKSAQSGISNENGEYIRFEITFRNSLADSAYKAYTIGTMSAYFLGYLSKMIDEVTLNMVRHILDKDMTINPKLFELFGDKSYEGTKMWLEQVVLPCLQKMALREPEYVIRYIQTLDKIVSDMVE